MKKKLLLIGAEPDRMPRLQLLKNILDTLLDVDVEVFKAVRRFGFGKIGSVLRYIGNIIKLIFARADYYYFLNIPDIIGIPLLYKSGVLVYDSRSPWKEVLIESGHKRLARLAGWIEQQFCKYADIITAPNQLLLDRAYELGKRNDKPIDIIPNKPFRPFNLDGELDIWNEYGLYLGLTIVFVGKLSKVEGSDLLADIICEVCAQTEDAKFVIVGDGPEADNLKSALEWFGDRVIFTGWVPYDDVQKWIHVSDICIMPRNPSLVSEYSDENSVWKIQEYMLHGKPTFVSRVGGFRETKPEKRLYVVSNDVFGYVLTEIARTAEDVNYSSWYKTTDN